MRTLVIAAALFVASLGHASPIPIALGTWDFDGSVTFDPDTPGSDVLVPFTGTVAFFADLTYQTLVLETGGAFACESVALPAGRWRLRPRPDGPGYRIAGLRSLVVDALSACLGEAATLRRTRGALDILPTGELNGSFRTRLRIRVGGDPIRGTLSGFLDGLKRPE